MHLPNVLSRNEPVELLTPKEMAEADRLTVAGVASRASSSCRMPARRSPRPRGAWPRTGDILVLAGPGNNGGDGFVAGALLRADGRDVRVALLGDRQRLKGDAALPRPDYDGPVETHRPDDRALRPISSSTRCSAPGSTGRSTGEAAAHRRGAQRERALPVLAVDLPSGIDGRTGAVHGVADPRRADTSPSSAGSPGHLLLPGRLHCGVTEVADIGIPASVLETIRPDDLPQRPGALAESPAVAAAGRPQIRSRPCLRRLRAGEPRRARRGSRRLGRCGPAPAW